VEEEHPHCIHNYVTNKGYKLFSIEAPEGPHFGKAQLVDPAPRVPKAKTKTYNAGDYVEIQGDSITLNNKGKDKVVFAPVDELVLTKDWERFEDDMTPTDLGDLGSHTFLLWWECVETPPLPSKRVKTATEKTRK
jgi:hypothetical protein